MSWLDTLEQIRSRDFRKASAAERERAARDVVNMSSYAVAVVAISPLPFSDAVLMLPIQTAMVMTIGHVYGRRIEKAEASELLLELGAIAGVSFLARQGIKALLPVVGALLTVPAAFAANWGMGRVAIEYFRNPGASRDRLREVYRQAKEEGSSLFSREDFDRFRKRHEGGIQEAVEEKPAPAPRKPKAEAEAAPRKGGAKTIGRAKSKPAAAPRAKAAAKKSIGRSKPAAGGEGEMTVRRLVEETIPLRIRAHPDIAQRIGGVVHLEIRGDGGGKWTVDMRRPADCVASGLKGEPKVTVRCDAARFLKIAAGQADARMAVMAGELEFDPLDLELASEIGRLFT